MLANGVHILKIDQSEMYLQELKESLSNPWATMKLQQQPSILMKHQEVVKAITQPPTYLPPTHLPPTEWYFRDFSRWVGGRWVGTLGGGDF